MMFNGFGSIAAYEAEARRTGFMTERVPFQKDGERYFALITRLAQPSESSIASWHLFFDDESRELLDGVINGNSANFEEKLAEHSFSTINVREVPYGKYED